MNNYTEYEKLPLFSFPKFNYEIYSVQNQDSDKEAKKKRRGY